MGFLRYALLAAKTAQDNYFNQPRVKGFIGEKEVRIHLRNEPFLLYDFNIIGDKHTQIDHILINTKGIIVIETKNYGGIIKGNEHNDIWLQIINRKTRKFLSPIKQNDYHIKRLRETFDLVHIPIHSVICFSDRAVLSVSSITQVIHIKHLNEVIDQFSLWTQSFDKIKSIYQILSDYKINNPTQK